MARKIVCKNCHKDICEAVKKFDEVWEYLQGSPKKNMVCDDCGVDLTENNTVFAGVLTDSKSNPVYEKQHPDRWVRSYIDVI